MNKETYGLADNQSLMVMLSKVFKLPDQKLGEFAAECKKLTDEDMAWFRERFTAEFGVVVG